MLIYKATNLINGKVYIGKTIKKLKSRIAEHKSDINRGKLYYFQRALVKYGFNNFQWDILEETTDLDILNQLEIHYIELYNSRDRHIGYNVSYGGMGGGNRHNAVLSEETKQKISIAKLGKSWGMHSDTTRQLISNSRKGYAFTDTHKANLKKARANRITTVETKLRMSNSSKGRVNIKTYILTDPNGIEYETINGLTSFCNEHGLTSSNLHKVITGERTHHKGWTIKPMTSD